MLAPIPRASGDEKTMTRSDAPSRRAANRRAGLMLAVVALLFFVAAVVKFKGFAP